MMANFNIHFTNILNSIKHVDVHLLKSVRGLAGVLLQHLVGSRRAVADRAEGLSRGQWASASTRYTSASSIIYSCAAPLAPSVSTRALVTRRTGRAGEGHGHARADCGAQRCANTNGRERHEHSCLPVTTFAWMLN